METQRQEFRIGIMVLTCIIFLVLLTVFFGKRPVMNFGGDSNAIQVRFQRAPGIKRNSPVYKNGIQVGRVTRVELVDNDRQAEVTISLDRHRKIYTDEECRIRQNTIMGEASLEFAKKANFTGKPEEITPGSVPYLVGVASLDLMSGFGSIEGDITKIIQNVAEAAEQLGTFVERINSVIGSPEEFQARQETFEAVVNETRQTMASVKQTTDGISHIVNDPLVQSNIRKVISDLPEVIEHSRVLVEESTLFIQAARTLVEKGHTSLDTLAASLEKVTRTLDVVTKIADQIEGDVPEIVTAIKRSALRLESLFSELTLIVENFRNADGTVKRLIRDPEAYEKLLVTLGNVEKITREVDMMLRVDVKPIAHNAKILTDKAARDPSIFVRNLLRKEPPTKPLPYCFGGGMYGILSYPPTTVIDGEVVEVLEEIPMPVNRTPAVSLPKVSLPLPKWNGAQKSRPVPTTSGQHYERRYGTAGVGTI
jgi:phospholipid/cholesterol/gamma-HCH transport system substrate-binding protein